MKTREEHSKGECSIEVASTISVSPRKMMKASSCTESEINIKLSLWKKRKIKNLENELEAGIQKSIIMLTNWTRWSFSLSFITYDLGTCRA